MKIAVLGWGSLLWDKRPDFDRWHGGWLPDGPLLKLEFSRVSETRDGALTLVIDDENGEACPVSYVLSKRQELDDAVCDLRCRESTILKRIGFYQVDGTRAGKPHVPDSIKIWAFELQIDAVVWTGLSSNFQEKTGNDFSVGSAMDHLKNLSPEGKSQAKEYFSRAPDFIDTPLLRMVSDRFLHI